MNACRYHMLNLAKRRNVPWNCFSKVNKNSTTRRNITFLQQFFTNNEKSMRIVTTNEYRWERKFSSKPLHSAQIDSDPVPYDGVNARAEIKLGVLEEAQINANKARALYRSSKSATTKLSEESIQNIYDNWIQKEVNLSDAYSKAIKYTAKLRTKDVAKKAQRLLDEMILRHRSIQEESTFLSYHDGPQFNDRNVLDLVSAIERDYSNTDSPSETREGIPVPTMKDFSNVLHSWASSKVRRKGLHAESLLYRMMELAYFYPENFQMPDSKTFGLVIKCYAGSTYKESKKRIEKLHKIHEKLAAIDTVGVEKDNPFFLMHSIKSIKNYHGGEEKDLENWFDRLHKFVSQPPADIFEANADHDRSNPNSIDLTGTYTAIIRGYSKMTGNRNAGEKCLHALERMQELCDLAASRTNAIASVDLKVGAFNLFLGCNTSDEKLLAKKLLFLDAMIDAAKTTDKTMVSSVPHPNVQSFAHCIKALSILRDPSKITEEGERILSAFESLVEAECITPSPKVHNAIIELYLNAFGRDKASMENLPSIFQGVSMRMERLAQLYPEIEPDIFTFTLFLKACTVDDGDAANRTARIDRAKQIFKDLQGFGEEGDSNLNDKCYFFMMKCISNNTSDPEEKKTKIIQLFSDAATAGLVSADVLKMLKINTSHDEFTEIAGNGRLADKWIENVTSGLALYTDGTTGGAGKNARRKGKSTSNWAKKQRMREDAFHSRKQEKSEKKRLKREREQNASRRK